MKGTTMATCSACGSTYSPPDTGDEMPASTAEWQFVCWVRGKLADASFCHRPAACRDVLMGRIAELETQLRDDAVKLWDGIALVMKMAEEKGELREVLEEVACMTTDGAVGKMVREFLLNGARADRETKAQ